MTSFGRLLRAFNLFLLITSSSIFGASFAYAQVATSTTATSTSAVTTSASAITSTPTSAPGVIPSGIDPYNDQDVQTAVQAYFSNNPTMVNIARCESSFQQYDHTGLPFFNSDYTVVGVFQESVAHMPEALAQGWDITTLPGNLAYANYLYDQNGTDPWLDSYNCWGSSTAAQTTPVTTTVSTPTTIQVTTATSSTLSAAYETTAVTAPVSQPVPGVGQVIVLGMSGPTIQKIQQMLNASGYPVASSGPGSPGQETQAYGSLTRAAVRAFQCAKGIACSGNEGTSGFGAVDARTYAALVAAAPASSQSNTAQTGIAYTGGNSTPAPGASKLTQSQIDAIIGLVQSFDADQKVVDQVRAALGQ